MMKKKSKAKLSLVGAGPGDPDLITIKGVRALQSADVILYDALVDTRLLEYRSDGTDCIYVGKRAGQPYIAQEEINQLIVDLALKDDGQHVVRLKGGDPFIFGRGFEEIQFAAAKAIETEVIPGLSSGLAAPAVSRIPLTFRGLSREVRLITAATREGRISEELLDAVGTKGTLVIYMGVKALPKIVRAFQEKSLGQKPVVVIQEGTNKNEKIVFGEINSIIQNCKKENIQAPALIIIGEVVGLHPEFQKQEFAENF
ncbi:MAG: uroporphyrinogen-III C-methyltransferase [Bacteroidetes bacterium]|nr:MAG: uroporphyrinogen-III C-methyltransferase [Bacteroidota bacterium]